MTDTLWLFDLVLGAVVFEAIVLLVLPRVVPALSWISGPHRSYLWPGLLSGALLVLAGRLALDGVSPPLVVAALSLGGVVHGIDLALRWRLDRPTTQGQRDGFFGSSLNV